MNFERIIDTLSGVFQKLILTGVATLVVVNIVRCGSVDSLNTYQLSAEWCGSCPVADNYKTFKLSESLQGEFLFDYKVKSLYDKIKTKDVLVCTSTENQVCTSIEVWRNNNIIKVYR